MAMTRKLWSISGLSIELEKDRRTVAAALASTPPDGELYGKKAWFLSTALEAVATLNPHRYGRRLLSASTTHTLMLLSAARASGARYGPKFRSRPATG